jgi:hypothetical protein
LSLGKRMVLKTTTLSWINFSIIHWIFSGNLRQRSFVAASEWFQKSVSRTCFPIRNHANKFIIIFNEDNHNSKDKWKEFQSFQEAWKFLRDLRRNSSSNFNQLSGSKKILHNSFFQRQFKRG